MASAKEVMKKIEDNEVKFVDLRFTDIRGKEQHITVPISHFDEDRFTDGQAFDGSSMGGWRGVQASDMLLIPDPDTAVMDPFREEPTLILTCDVVEPTEGKGYDRDPRSIARRAEAYLQSSGIGDIAYFGPEPEFFIFDSVTWKQDMSGSMVAIDSEEASWSSEVAGAGQCEIGTKFAPLVPRADWLQRMQYVIHNVAHAYGKTATFMPKPLVGDNGSGMHVHMSIWKDGTNLFNGDKYAGLSDFALFYIGGIIKHARALNAITNPSTNSYKRLVPHYEAPVKLAYSARNRSASIRIPFVNSPKARRIEARFPDPVANPYLAFAALMMAGLDGVQNRIHPGDPAEKNLYDLPPEEDAKIPTVCHSLEQALEALDRDREFLTRGGVFDNDMIDAFITLKMEEVTRLRMVPHPIEFDMYYSC